MKKKPTAAEIYPQLSPESQRELVKKLIEIEEWERQGLDAATAKQITSIIHELGVPANLLGHNYIRTAVYLAVQYKGADYFNCYGFFGKIINDVAALYRVDYTRIERGIRHAIAVAWERGNPEAQQHYFGWTINTDTCKPTCSEFVATVADAIRMGACYND